MQSPAVVGMFPLLGRFESALPDALGVVEPSSLYKGICRMLVEQPFQKDRPAMMIGGWELANE